MTEAASASAGFYLDSLLAPLAPWMARPDVTDIYINRAQEVRIDARRTKSQCRRAAHLVTVNAIHDDPAIGRQLG